MKKISYIAIFPICLFLTSCNINNHVPKSNSNNNILNSNLNSTTYGEDLSSLSVFNGYFEEEIIDIEINCLSGSKNCYSLENNTLTFSSISEDSVYSISGKLNGNIIINIDSNYKFDLELHGFSLVSENECPISIINGDKVSITAKKNYDNYIYDNRPSINEEAETQYSSSIYSLADLEICGKGSLTLISKNNNGIHTKDDLEVKNLSLFISCCNNALKGNDSVTLISGTTTLISTKGDGIKTTNSDISDKGNQRGIINIIGGNHTIYAACDGIDAAYDVIVDNENTSLKIYTDKYSNYSDEITSVTESIYYIKISKDTYKFSIKYYNSKNDIHWEDASYYSKLSSERNTYYYYTFPKLNEYSSFQIYTYTSTMEQGQEANYYAVSDYLTPHDFYDTIHISTYNNGSFKYSWTNYATTQNKGGGFGGMQEGNIDKGDYSTKGIKANNEIIINNGIIDIKSYDDSIHANNNITLENGNTPLGKITINSGNICVYSNDDGIHADGLLQISNGNLIVSYSYEGLEGNVINIDGGHISIYSKDDGINSTATSGTGFKINDGYLYVHANGDGIDSNSSSSYTGIIFNGGKIIVISTSNGNSAIDTERGYQYNGGDIVAVMPSGGMTNESTNCSNFSSIGASKSIYITANNYLSVSVNNLNKVIIKITESLSSKVIFLGSNSIQINSISSINETLDLNGVYWY